MECVRACDFCCDAMNACHRPVYVSFTFLFFKKHKNKNKRDMHYWFIVATNLRAILP